MPVPVLAYSHVRLTVTDIVRSRAFYEAVFGFPVVYEAPPANADQATKDQFSFLFGGVIYGFAGGILGLRPVAATGDRFNEDRVGLDHLSFAVVSLTELTAAEALLNDLGIAHSGVKDLGTSHVLEFRDPDNIALEFIARR
ncbi:MAG: VOC family protein [Microbacteriaceae bacterium]|nr:VOC family protein [Microbacteriaceae bacterium]